MLTEGGKEFRRDEREKEREAEREKVCVCMWVWVWVCKRVWMDGCTDTLHRMYGWELGARRWFG